MRVKKLPTQKTLRWTAVVCGLLLLAGWFIWNHTLTSWESRQTGSWLVRVYQDYLDGKNLHVSMRVQPGRDEAFVPIDLHLQYPDRLQLKTEVSDVLATITRNQDELWIHVPDREFGLLGKSGIPKFTGYPDSLESVELPPLELPLTWREIRSVPLVLKVTSEEEGYWRIRPSALGERAGLPQFEARLWMPELHSQDWPLTGKPDRLEIDLPGSGTMTVEASEWSIGRTPAPTWDLAAPEGHAVETVALAHLYRCLQTLPGQLTSRPPVLPEATGQRELLAKSGKGRLELYDGVRVLFLQGSPEEMGTQHGELLKEQVLQMKERILYGVGVTSSFEKRRWFVGEIEEAQSRVQPFVREEHLREMDALAAATGMHIQEARLLNFFPELFHCSGFALHGKATFGKQMYHGRILDYMRGVGLEENAVVMVCKPDGANAWVNVGYAGFLGSVTAMNEKKLAIGEMGGRGEGQWDGKPMAQLVREVMEQCDTIEEAVEWMRSTPRTCEYYYVISDAKSMKAVGIKATPDIFETVWSGESHPQLPVAIEDAVLLSADDRYEELVKRVKAGYGYFGPSEARDLMTRPVCMTSNIQSVLFAPGTLDFWVANADHQNVASHTRYTEFNLADLLEDVDS